MAKGIILGVEETDDSMFSEPLRIGTVKTLGEYARNIQRNMDGEMKDSSTKDTISNQNDSGE